MASKYNKHIKPIVSIHKDFYTRIFFEVNESKKECGKLSKKCGLVIYCEFCGDFTVQHF